MSDLPPGPWSKLWGKVWSETGAVVADYYGVAPVGDLLIRAERESDPTPLDAEWLVSVGGEHTHGGMIDFTTAGGLTFHIMANCLFVRSDSVNYLAECPTRGTFRTAMRLLGITIEEPKQ